MAELPVPQSPTREAIFAAYEADADDGFRAHLGASLIGRECERALWYGFRWTTRLRHPGRMLRLFETGQREEARLVANLRRIGATVLEVDPETGRQFQVAAHGGHFGGSIDGLALGLPEAPKTWHVLEFKTHSRKSFTALAAKGVEESKPQHFAQMQVYLYLGGLSRHEKPGKPPSLRVDYDSGLATHSEWVCLEHQGYPRRKAAAWWYERAPHLPLPQRVDQALACVAQLRCPAEIAVRPDGRYTRVVAARFNH